VFDEAAGTFHRVGDLSSRHRSGAVAVLADGSVFVSGGETPSVPVTAVERYDPSSGQWTGAGGVDTARRGHTATALQDGRVLLVGGCCDATGQALLSAAEIFDPVHGGVQPTGSLATARAFHTATLLPDGRVVVAGGFDNFAGTTASVEIYDPATGRFEPGGALQAPRALHAAILLTDGRVLVLGGQTASEKTDVFDPAADRWDIGPALQPASKLPTATLLSNGKVLVFGGEDAGGFPVSTAFLYE
jgi:N-acetylneuraminic acid mutarotase